MFQQFQKVLNKIPPLKDFSEYQKQGMDFQKKATQYVNHVTKKLQDDKSRVNNLRNNDSRVYQNDLKSYYDKLKLSNVKNINDLVSKEKINFYNNKLNDVYKRLKNNIDIKKMKDDASHQYQSIKNDKNGVFPKILNNKFYQKFKEQSSNNLNLGEQLKSKAKIISSQNSQKAQTLSDSVKGAYGSGSTFFSRKARKWLLWGMLGIFVFSAGSQLPHAIATYMIQKERLIQDNQHKRQNEEALQK